MTFLPIVERELRRGARRPLTYRVRLAVVAASIAVALLVIFSNRSNIAPHELAKQLFIAFGVLAMAFSLLAGLFLTADCLSSEKREGTLGLLFLTDLKGHDVVFGKLAATSLQTVFALLGIFPVLALPLLMGGVTSGEVWRLLVVVLVTVFFSLAVGMGVSAICRETRQALIGTFGLLALCAGLCPVFWWLFQIIEGYSARSHLLLYPSPVYLYIQSLDEFYRNAPGPSRFWTSLSLITCLGVISFLGACFILPRIWREKLHQGAAESGLTKLWKGCRYGNARWRNARSAILRENPFYWLASRDRGIFLLAMILMAALLAPWLGFFLTLCNPVRHRATDEALLIVMFLCFALHQVIKLVWALESTRRLSDDAQSGALEVLSVTPLEPQKILSGLRRAVYGLLSIPFWIGLIANLLVIWIILVPNPARMKPLWCWVFLGGIILLLTDCHAISWVGARLALKLRRHHRAVLGVLLRIMLPPWIALFIFFFATIGMSEGGAFGLFTFWVMVCAVLDIALAQSAKDDLLLNFRKLAAGETPRPAWETRAEVAEVTRPGDARPGLSAP